MRKILVTAAAALFTATALVAAAAPANADSFSFNLDLGGFGSGWGPGYGGYGPYPQSSWSSHVDWCFDHHPSYNANSNTYITNSGKVKYCNSPYV